MNVTATGLAKASGAAAAVAGGIFITVQIGHPAADSFTTETAQWVAREWAKSAMAALALLGITGIYLRQYRRSGLLGLIGYALFMAGYLAMFSLQTIAAAVLPLFVESDPEFVNDIVAAAAGGTAVGDIGALQSLMTISGIGYMFGGLLFGIAIFRTAILPRWAGALLAVSTFGTASLAVLPDAFNRPFAVPTGIALIALGVALWRNPVESTTATLPVPTSILVGAR